MRIQCCSQTWLAAAICVIAGLPFAAADDTPGVVRMTDYQSTQIRPIGFFTATADSENVDCVTIKCGEDECCSPVNSCSVPDNKCCEGDCREGRCDTGVDTCNVNCSGCGCGCSGKNNSCLLEKIFGGPKSRCSCYSCDYCGKRSEARGHGAPFCGKYQITYSHQPAYADTRDGLAWGAQGYGMPVTVPTAPVVRYSYNYSHGTPASRLTPLSTYNPATSPKQLFLQSW